MSAYCGKYKGTIHRLFLRHPPCLFHRSSLLTCL
uniref:Uncharacterized protein n=1 Tax=Arundo donax TaxID=35708 RepID=A0A0A9EN28_ARUDO